MIDGPTTGVPRQSFPYKHLTLTPFTITVPRAAGSGVIKKVLEKEGTVEKWDKSSWAQKRQASLHRKSQSDFGRFNVMIAQKRRRDIVRKAVAKAKKST